MQVSFITFFFIYYCNTIVILYVSPYEEDYRDLDSMYHTPLGLSSIPSTMRPLLGMSLLVSLGLH